MSEIIGHNDIGGARSAAGTITLHSHDASSGEALPFVFTQATTEDVDAAQAATSACPAFRALSANRLAEEGTARSATWPPPAHSRFRCLPK